MSCKTLKPGLWCENILSTDFELFFYIFDGILEHR